MLTVTVAFIAFWVGYVFSSVLASGAHAQEMRDITERERERRVMGVFVGRMVNRG